MAWKIELSREAVKALDKLDKPAAQGLLRFLHERVSAAENPRKLGEALKGSELGNFWKYRVGDYRIIADIQDRAVRILVVRVGNRRQVYR